MKTPSDYCIVLRNLPKVVNIKELQSHLKSHKINGIKTILIPYIVKENKDEINEKIKVLNMK